MTSNTDSEHINGPTTTKGKGPTWKYLVTVACFLIIAYFANVEIQSYLGRKAVSSTGLDTRTLDEALQMAQSANKLVLADLSAIWCSTCRKLDREIFSHPDVKEAINENYIFARIEYESAEGEAFMTKYNVKGFPTLLILNSTGEKQRQLPLTFNPQKFVANL